MTISPEESHLMAACPGAIYKPHPKYTIGMATYQDFHGLYFTVQALRMYHDLSDCEILIIDNCPSWEHKKEINGLLANCQASGMLIRVIDMEEPKGTSPSRDRIFQEAFGEFVLIIDCHVLLGPDALKHFKKFCEENPKCNDILCGPLIMDTLNPLQLNTHFANVWRKKMWGIWSGAWTNADNSLYFDIIEREGRIYPVTLDMERKDMVVPGVNGEILPGHERVLVSRGYHKIGMDPNDKPVPVPGQGLGLFACRKAAWLGFNPHSRGFGGEELYIHEKFRRAGFKCLLIPGLQWLHRFARIDPPKYPISDFGKLRNYVVEFQEIERDCEEVRLHFETSHDYTDPNDPPFYIANDDWTRLLEDPVKWEEPVTQQACCSGDNIKVIDALTSPEQIMDMVEQIPRDLEKHLQKFKELSQGLDHVTEFSSRRESTIGFLNGRPKKLISYNSEFDSFVKTCVELVKDTTSYTNIPHCDTTRLEEIEETDLLFLDTEHSYARLSNELQKFGKSVRRYIVMHDTALYGMSDDPSASLSGGPGMVPAIAGFCKDNPEWSVIYDTDLQYGLIVLSKNPEDKPKLPSTITMFSNFAVAMKDYVASGLEHAPKELMEERLLICSICPFRADDRCTSCGCYIQTKASQKVQQCPRQKWPGETLYHLRAEPAVEQPEGDSTSEQ